MVVLQKYLNLYSIVNAKNKNVIEYIRAEYFEKEGRYEGGAC